MAQTSLFPYTPVPNSLRRLLEKIPSIGIPDKGDAKWLAGIGFSGGNNQMNLSVMRKVGIISSNGQPTDLYQALRDKDKAKFAAGIRKHYADLFATYPDAHRRDDEALIAFIRSKTNYGEKTQQRALQTFKVLCEFADFEQPGGEPEPEQPETETKAVKEEQKKERRVAREAGKVGLTVNIQLQLPPSADGEVYDKLFAAMAKHLKGLVSVE